MDIVINQNKDKNKACKWNISQSKQIQNGKDREWKWK